MLARKVVVAVVVAVVGAFNVQALQADWDPYADGYCEYDDLECEVDGGEMEDDEPGNACTPDGNYAPCGTRTITRRQCLSWMVTSANGTVTFSPTKPSVGLGGSIECADEQTTVTTVTLYKEKPLGGGMG